MNILFLIGKYPYFGGTEKVTTILANEFDTNGHHVSIASFEQAMPELQDELNSTIKLHTLSYPTLSFTNQDKLRRIVRQEKVDIIINQWCLPFYVTLLCKTVIRGTGCKLVSVHHNAPDSNARITDLQIKMKEEKSPFLKRFFLYYPKFVAIQTIIRLSMRYVYRNSDNYVVLSDSFRTVFSNFSKIKSPKKLRVISNPLTIPSNGRSITEKENLIIYVGRIDYNQKRVNRIIEIWEKINKLNPDWKLEIIGEGPEKNNLQQIVEERKIARVSFEGFQDPTSYYKRASLLLLTSEYEGFGLVIVEGMNFGTIPLVLGTYSAVYDIIDNDKNGYILPAPFNAVEFSDRIQNLIDNSIKRKEMSCDAIQSIGKFSVGEVVSRWNKLFDELKKGIND
ncbi:glycosyltransferase [Mangrovibacterium diazotrophicum]|uniref:Glycosyltransferase involved in cell wall biosynthesis n=1 Tax=Mangrovibacterium diazotrophicum TaxID=1261403 RepID=A0A419VWW1_9BACT|nr:glycosyltransferase [Mangrovibacterium diazotrophicum]RKD87722.1 glycosyltransferase involved in cell wall biosynthesis [Mangrovibacterium diazotrophicum]